MSSNIVKYFLKNNKLFLVMYHIRLSNPSPSPSMSMSPVPRWPSSGSGTSLSRPQSKRSRLAPSQDMRPMSDQRLGSLPESWPHSPRQSPSSRGGSDLGPRAS